MLKVVACFNASGVYILLFVAFKVARIKEIYTDNFYVIKTHNIKYIISHHIIYHITSHHTMSYLIILYYIILCYVICYVL